LEESETAIVLRDCNSIEYLDASPGIQKGDAVLAQLKHIGSHRYVNTITVRVMAGKKSAIHDRFFVVDDGVWLLGSSLNEFGSRGTMMVALHDPSPIRERLFEVWANADELELWLKRRKERQKGGAREESQ
jgi:hypothetical protein